MMMNSGFEVVCTEQTQYWMNWKKQVERKQRNFTRTNKHKLNCAIHGVRWLLISFNLWNSPRCTLSSRSLRSQLAVAHKTKPPHWLINSIVCFFVGNYFPIFSLLRGTQTNSTNWHFFPYVQMKSGGNSNMFCQSLSSLSISCISGRSLWCCRGDWILWRD